MSTQAEKFERDVLDRLVALGIRPGHVTLRYMDDLRYHEIIVDQDGLSEEAIGHIIEDMRGCGELEFGDQRSKDIKRQVEMRAYRALLQRKASAMPGLPKFDPEMGNLAEFAREIETYCGVEPGTVLEAKGECLLTLRAVHGSVEFRECSRVLEAASVALADRSDVGVGVVGGTG